jgi:hypothetical protein
MTNAEAAAEILRLLESLEKLGGPRPSAALTAHLNKALSQTGRSSSNRPPEAASNGRTQTMAGQTVSDMAKRLRDAFNSDTEFNAVLDGQVAPKLKKDEVIELHEIVFARKKRFPRSISKKTLIEEFRSDRIAAVRAAS